MVNIAIVGIGGYGWNLVSSILRQSKDIGCRLVAATKPRSHPMPQENTDALAKANVEIFTDYYKMIEAMKGKCQVVYICTGISAHMPQTIAAAEMGYHIHLEKPAAATIQEVDAMLDAVKRAGKLCLIGTQSVYSSDIITIKDRIVSGKLGKVKTITSYGGWPRAKSYYDRNNWAGKLKSGDEWVLDGPGTNAMAHYINNILMWASPTACDYATPRSVRAELYSAGPYESHNLAAIEIKTVEGPTAYFYGTHTNEKLLGPIIEIDCENGRVRWDMWSGYAITYADGTSEGGDIDKTTQDKMVANFVKAVANNDPSLIRCSLDDARKVTLTLNGAHESAVRVARIGESFYRNLTEANGDTRIFLDGIDELMAAAAASHGLFSDLGDKAPAWAKATKAFDVTNYRSFPQKFICG